MRWFCYIQAGNLAAKEAVDGQKERWNRRGVARAEVDEQETVGSGYGRAPEIAQPDVSGFRPAASVRGEVNDDFWKERSFVMRDPWTEAVSGEYTVLFDDDVMIALNVAKPTRVAIVVAYAWAVADSVGSNLEVLEPCEKFDLVRVRDGRIRLAPKQTAS